MMEGQPRGEEPPLPRTGENQDNTEQSQREGITFATKIREHREQLGLSQRALSKKAGLNSGYVHRIENQTRNPGRSSLVKIFQALEIDMDGREAEQRIMPLLM